MSVPPDILQELHSGFPAVELTPQATCDQIPTVWVPPDHLHSILRYLQRDIAQPYRTLYDLCAVDERARLLRRANDPSQRQEQPASDFTVVYHLLSYAHNADVRLKVPLSGEYPTLPSVVDLWPAANWYEREAWDMFGITFAGQPHLRRLLMPPTWTGHPLRKDHPARATDMDPFQLTDDKQEAEQAALQFDPEAWGLERRGTETDFMFLNLGPQHPGTHGPMRFVLQLDGEKIVDVVPDIGFHHRGAEKMGERQSWHTYIPYTDRIDYLGGVMNNLAYLLSVEKLAGIEVPERARVIRVMLAELFRLSSHLVWYGTFAQDVGALSPVFYMFTDREYLLSIVEAICGARMHPSWFRIGGVAQDLPQGWDTLVRDFVQYLPRRLAEYDKLVMRNRLFKVRTQGVGSLTLDEAMEWGVTGPNLRACGLAWDFRKQRPYSGYEHFNFDVPTAEYGDCYARAIVHVEEMRQSLRILEQCLANMPPGPYKAEHSLTTPPPKEHTMHDIETLIAHFLNVSWGPVIPAGEACVSIEATKGNNGYYLISDGDTRPYRLRIRTPSFPHIQIVPLLSRGHLVSDLLAILGSIDFVMGDVDR